MGATGIFPVSCRSRLARRRPELVPIDCLIVDSPAGQLVKCGGVPCSHDAREKHDPALPEVHGLRAGFFDNGEEPTDLQAVLEKPLAECQWHPK